MFEKHREKKTRAAQRSTLAAWPDERDSTIALLDFVRTFQGEPTTELVLKKGEQLFAEIGGVSLFEDRRAGGEWKGRSQGVSIPIGTLGGKSVRYRVGANRGHYVSGTPVATAVDTGTAFITNRRVAFRGHKQSRECSFDKLLSCEHVDGESIFSVSNRQRTTTIHYGSKLNDWVQFRYTVAMANYQETTDALVRELEERVTALDGSRPVVEPLSVEPARDGAAAGVAVPSVPRPTHASIPG